MKRNNEITARARRDYGSCPTRLRLVMTLLLVLLWGISEMWGQTTYTYYAIHCNGKGYLKQYKGIVGNDGTFRFGNGYDDNGTTYWVYSSDGYLRNNMYYLNAVNSSVGTTLYLSVSADTKWDLADDDGKKRFQLQGTTKILCLDNTTPVLRESTESTLKYTACEMTINNETSWTGPHLVNDNGTSMTIGSPQLITYLRAYYKQKVNYSFTNDNNSAVSATGQERRIYSMLTYKSTSDTNRPDKWDIDETAGVIYNKTTSNVNNVKVTFTVTPIDPIALKIHQDKIDDSSFAGDDREFTLSIQAKAFTPATGKKYLLFFVNDGSYRFPYDKAEYGNDTKLMSNGKKAQLSNTDNPNEEISWAIEPDTEGYYAFKNIKTGRYFYFDDKDYTISNYGMVKVGAIALPDNDTHYKFRIYRSDHGTYKPSYHIIPYCYQFAVHSNNGMIQELFCALNPNQTPQKSSNAISLYKASGQDNTRWAIYAYEPADKYCLKTNYNIGIPNEIKTGTTATITATGDYNFTAQSYHWRNVKGAPGDNNQELELLGTGTKKDITYSWEVTGDVANYLASTTFEQTNVDKSTFTINVNSLPEGGVSGTLKVTAKVTSPEPLEAPIEITINILPPTNGEIPTDLQEIATLAGITDPNGHYKLTADASDSPGVTDFKGFLDGQNHIISNLSTSLFTSLSGSAVVRNVMFKDINVSGSGPQGAVAGTASGSSRIYNVGVLSGTSGSTVSSTDSYCGGLVGLLDGAARVINCFSYANIIGGTYVGGIVGYNNYATTSADLKTMVMNCMFYGDITGGSDKAPIYNGKIITNRGDQNGVSNFNYFWGGASYVQNQQIKTYNCALMAETRFLQRFEFFRHLLNSHRELAAWWATGSTANKDQMMKWVLEPSQIGSSTPYPILKTPGKYPSVVNIDAEHATTQTERNKGGLLGTLSVTIEMGEGGAQFTAPEGASITNSSLTLNITDKDPEHFNFNYGKVQLPYYNDVGTKNYTGNRVVTGWKITSITGGTKGTFTTGADAEANAEGEITAAPYNFADRNCTDKDLYDVSSRVFNQGAYWDVPEGVTAITIQPYWAKAAYLADAYADVVYKQDMSDPNNVPNVGGGEVYVNNQNYSIAGEIQTVYTNSDGAINNLELNSNHNVYDYAIVLVGNFHRNGVTSSIANQKYTIMSIDEDHDNEPDYSYILRFDNRTQIHAVRVDFLNIPGLGMAQKSTEGTGTYNFGIMQPMGWFEATNTSLFRVTQFEYDAGRDVEDPFIVQGGVFEQWVGGQQTAHKNKINYFHVGGNVWFKEFHRGAHQDKTHTTKHPPISVTGGDYDEFYLSGLYRGDITNFDDNAECYINGGRFGIVAGAAMEGIGNVKNHTNGNIIWQIQNADINEFYGGGLNAAHPVEGNITNVITGGYIKQFCGGPKFGDMNSNKTVITTAKDCKFDVFFGAGYGGNSYSRFAPSNITSINGDYGTDKWNTFVNNNYKQEYNGTYKGVSVTYTSQYLPMSNNTQNVARILIDFVSFSLATTHNVMSKLTGCTITNNFYGGGCLGKVDGPVTSTLTNCTIGGSAFGAGFSASLPTVEVMNTGGFTKAPYYNSNLGVYLDPSFPSTVTYTWQHANTVNNTTAIDKQSHILYTTEDLTTLGSVTGKATLNIEGTTTVAGSVYGGGEESAVGGDTEVNVSSGTIGTTGEGGAEYGNVFGGGKGKKKDANTDDIKAVTAGQVKGNTNVNISGGTILHNIYGGGAFGSVGNFTYNADNTISGYTSGGKCSVTVTGGTIGTNGDENGMVFGSSRGDVGEPGAITDKQAWVYDTEVVIGTQSETPDLTTPLIRGTVYGGGENGHNYNDAMVTIHSGTIGIASGEKITKGGHDYEGPRYPYRGNVYGGGCGTDTYTGTDNLTNFNFKAGIVQGNATVEMDGGHVLHNIYGGGAMGSVGTYSFNDSDEPTGCADGTGLCTVTITGGDIGGDNMTMKASDGPDDFGHVFGAGRGDVIDKAICPNIEKVAYYNNTALTIKGTAFVRGSVYGGSESGHVLNDTHVVIGEPITDTFSGSECQIGNGDGVNQRYTSGEWEVGSSVTLKPTNHWDYKDDGDPYDQNVVDQGKYMDGTSARGGQKVATDGHTFYGNVFGGGSGYYPYAAGKWLFTAGRVGGDTHVEINSGHILNNVYGGCEMSDVTGSATVEMKGGTVGVPRNRGDLEKNPSFGHIFGAGMGDKRTFFNEVTNIASSVVNVSGGRVYGSVYGGGEDGHILGNAVTTITGGTIGSNAKTSDIEAIFAFDGNVFGGGQGSPTALTAGTIGGNATLNVQGGTMLGSAYGGGRIASVGTFFADANDTEKYGKMQEGDDHGIITVNLTGGTIENNVYGGCMGTLVESAAVEQNRFAVSKKVTVKLNEGKVYATDKGCVVKGSIFGCNNVNSSPQEDVEVYIWATQNAAASQIAGIVESTGQKVLGRYDVKGVYGGGNMAAYKPNGGKTTTYSTHVTIDGCDLTSIEQVYGGGNAASTPATEVTVNGTFEIGELFGGGNGKDKISYNGTTELDNPGANVGFYAYEDNITSETATTEKPASDTPESRADNYGYGDGVATVNIFGGLIHSVFGGSNTKGNVKETAITLLEEKKQENSDEACCPFRVDEVYGGGKSAPMDAEAKMYMACIPGLTAAYGGAEAADIQGGVTLNITNGRFDRVFGGNNKSGTIRGPIEVNIEETGCRPVIIGELYGGGNLAPYSVFGYNDDGTIRESGTTPLYKDPVVNVKSFTSIGNVFGGGYGSTATMVGNPTVNINVALGDKATHSEATIGENSKSHDNDDGFPIPSHVSGKIGAINNVYGGGNEAMVKGNTKVNIGTTEYEYTLVNKELTVGTTDVSSYYTRTGQGTSADPYVYTKCAANSTAAANATYYERKDVVGADIRGNVYGGGNNATVTGNTEVIIGKEKTQTP